MKLFSVIIPFYNTREYLIEALDSIKNQSEFDLTKLEVILVNDGCDVIIEDVINNYNSFFEIKYFKKENGNWGSAINYVIDNKLISGQWVTILDADDCYCNNAFKNFEKGTLVYPDIIASDFFNWSSKNDQKIISKLYFKFKQKKHAITNKNKRLFMTPYSFPICKFYRSDLFFSLDKLNEKTYFQDINVYFGLLLKAKNIYYINKCLGKWRNDNANSSTNQSWSITKLNQWNNALIFLNSIGCTNISIYYTLVKKYRKSYKTNFHKPLVFNKKFEIVYLPKFLSPLVKALIFSYSCFSKKIFVLK